MLFLFISMNLIFGPKGATEVKRHVSAPIKVHTITTINVHQKTSYKDIVNADIVIVSFALLRNNNYLTLTATCVPEDVKTASAAWDPMRFEFHWILIGVIDFLFVDTPRRCFISSGGIVSFWTKAMRSCKTTEVPSCVPSLF
jgi:hypothetical protein